MTFFQTLKKIAVIPVIVIDHVQQAIPLARALQAGGLPIAEITLRTPAALNAIQEIASQMPQVLIGAGTVITLDQAKVAVDHGARYLVSPGLPVDVIQWSANNNIPFLGCAVTAAEIVNGMRMGLSVFKFFPSEAMGGLRTIKALSDPFPDIQFVPTGGVNQFNLLEYLQKPYILAVGGSWMSKRDWVNNEQYERVQQEALAACQIRDKSRQLPL
ncbi:MAG: bifunctional 4-hydroxy-2-oxoglutarate aldolase/2-dehydro-3-deoxy-phosphogluconate aldolase [Anaerolineaceae bacterium]|nr:bifunctional 4-hydroxy-2-oxoglutarate aldolase/2-dehydro-3-deoxy-phosphogluconate aldolase [Anaerolineaceae bacterium]